MIVSAWRSLAASRWFSRLSRSFSAIRGASGLDFRPRRFGASPASVPCVALLPPRVQVRRVQSLPTQQCPKLPRPGRTVRLAENAQLVLGGESSPHGLLRNGRVGYQGIVADRRPSRRGRGGGRNSSRATPSFRSAHHHLVPFPTSLLSPSFYLLALYCNHPRRQLSHLLLARRGPWVNS